MQIKSCGSARGREEVVPASGCGQHAEPAAARGERASAFCSRGAVPSAATKEAAMT